MRLDIPFPYDPAVRGRLISSLPSLRVVRGVIDCEGSGSDELLYVGSGGEGLGHLRFGVDRARMRPASLYSTPPLDELLAVGSSLEPWPGFFDDPERPGHAWRPPLMQGYPDLPFASVFIDAERSRDAPVNPDFDPVPLTKKYLLNGAGRVLFASPGSLGVDMQWVLIDDPGRRVTAEITDDSVLDYALRPFRP